jgi:hypothetical protein
MKRKVFIGRGHFHLYPNLFTVLVGRPGLGKGSAINPALRILQEADVTNILSDRITIEYILEKLSNGWSGIGPGAKPGTVNVNMDHTCFIISRELSVFVTASQFTIPILTDLWDSNEGSFIYGTRHKGEYKIDSPCVSLLGGSTQEWLISAIPPTAIGGGFTRRVNFVVAQDREQFIPWPVIPNHSPIKSNLIEDLRDMSLQVGEFKFDKGAVPLFEYVYKQSEPDLYDDEATTSYKTSKWAQVSKLAMCFSLSRGNDLIISKEDFQKGYDAVESVASNIPRVFRGVGESELVAASNKVLAFIETKGFASREEILKAHWRDVTSDDLDRILATFKEAKIIFDYQQGRKTMYASTKSVKQGAVPPGGTIP